MSPRNLSIAASFVAGPCLAAVLGLAAACSSGTTASPAGADTTASTDTAGTDTTASTDTTGSDAASTDAAPGDGTASQDSADTTKTPAFAEVTAIFEQRCVTCHRADALGLPGYAKLPLTADVAHAKLVGQPANETCGGTLVVPGKSAQSYLYLKVSQQTPCEGGHMPAKFEMLPAPPLTAEQLATIAAWIDDGAKP